MSKGSGYTRTSSSARPSSTSLSGGGATIIPRGSNEDKIRERLMEQIGTGVAQPVYRYKADAYEKVTGKKLPKDSLEIVFGRGALNSDDFYKALEQKEYSHIKTKKATIDGDSVTFIHGYKNFAEVRKLAEEVMFSRKVDKYNRLARRWGLIKD